MIKKEEVDFENNTGTNSKGKKKQGNNLEHSQKLKKIRRKKNNLKKGF